MVDQVLERFNCGLSDGERDDARTSNWRERYESVFMAGGEHVIDQTFIIFLYYSGYTKEVAIQGGRAEKVVGEKTR